MPTVQSLATLLAVAVAVAPGLAGAAPAEPFIDHTRLLAHRSHRDHVRMGLELGAIFVGGNRWYWRDGGEPNRVDWQLPFDARALEAKLDGSGWRFDGNPFAINAIGHPMFGMTTTFLARENGYGLGESFLISTLASGTWETFLEWAEYGSLNDLMFTSPAGVPLGETAYQILHHLRATRFELRGGLGTTNGATYEMIGASGELDTVPTVGAGTIRAGKKVSFDLGLTTDGAVRSTEGKAKTTIAGYYRNRAHSTLFAGVSAEFDYRDQKQRPERAWDLLATVAVGPSVDVQLRRRGVTVDVGTDLYLEAAMVKSQAFDAWRTGHPMAVVRNVLEGRPHPYYYAAGTSVDPRISIRYGGWKTGGKLAGSLFGSLDGHDRDQEQMTDDIHVTDHDASAEAWLGYDRRRISLTLAGQLHWRGGQIGDVHAETDEHGASLTLAYRQ